MIVTTLKVILLIAVIFGFYGALKSTIVNIKWLKRDLNLYSRVIDKSKVVGLIVWDLVLCSILLWLTNIIVEWIWPCVPLSLVDR